MALDRIKTLVLAFVTSSLSATAAPLYNAPFDHTGAGMTSQNDPASFGNFATSYGYIKPTGPMSVIQVVGTYGPVSGPITGFTVGIYSNNAGQPGALLFTQHFNGNAGETFVSNGSATGFACFRYTFGFNTIVVPDGWVSVVADLAIPANWSWCTGFAPGSGAAATSWSDFFGIQTKNPSPLNIVVN